MLTNALEILFSLLFLSKFDSKIGLFSVKCHKMCYFYIKSMHRIQHWVCLHIFLVILSNNKTLQTYISTSHTYCSVTLLHLHDFVTTYLCCKINSQACGLCKKRLIEHASRLFNIILYTHTHVHHLQD